MAQSIILRELATSEDAENTDQVKSAIADLQNLMGEGVTEEIGNAISRLLAATYFAGYVQGGADERYEG